MQLGVGVSSSVHERAFMSGQVVRKAGSLGGTGILLVPLVLKGPLELDLRVESGVLGLRGLGDRDASALRQVNEFAMLAHIKLGQSFLLRAGAVLVQAYTGFVYRGPHFARRVARELLACLDRDGVATASAAVGLDADPAGRRAQVR